MHIGLLLQGFVLNFMNMRDAATGKVLHSKTVDLIFSVC